MIETDKCATLQHTHDSAAGGAGGGVEVVSPDDYHSLSFWGTDADATGISKTAGADEKRRR